VRGQRAVCIVDERSTKGRARLFWVEPSKPRPNIKSSPLGDMLRHDSLLLACKHRFRGTPKS
jgi:hypothetical protein